MGLLPDEVEQAPEGKQEGKVFEKGDEVIMDWNAAALSALAGGVVSLLFAYVPYLKDWHDSVDPKFKPLIQALVLLTVALGRQAVVCHFGWECVYAGLGDTLGIWFAALVGNQTAFAVGVKQFKRGEWLQGATTGLEPVATSSTTNQLTDAEIAERISGKPGSNAV